MAMESDHPEFGGDFGMGIFNEGLVGLEVASWLAFCLDEMGESSILCIECQFMNSM